MTARRSRLPVGGALLLLGACAGTPPPDAVAVAPGCFTQSARIAFDFETAPASRCVVEGEREFSILVTPEHAPPINPSPWYAFRYVASAGADVTVHLRYLQARHRYRPKWRSGGESRVLETALRDDGRTATMVIPAGQAVVSAQELFGTAEYETLFARLDRSVRVERLTLGRSHDGRPVEALRIGERDAENLVILLGRQHPPEVSGAIAMDSFLDTLVALADDGRLDPRRIQVLAVPLLNPDGVARGHWRANLGGEDLNRDWGEFSQPETRAVAQWLNRLPASVRPAAMIDFHSTSRNTFYVQGEEASEEQKGFLSRWLIGQEDSLPGYAFTVDRRNANPGLGTAKNWFHANYAIPAYTYEVGDETDRVAIGDAASALAMTFIGALQPSAEQ